MPLKKESFAAEIAGKCFYDALEFNIFAGS
jgi:hypothetical protein